MEDGESPQKKRSIDDIIEHMTTGIGDGQYVPLGVTPQTQTAHVWSEYSPLINDGSDKHSYTSPQPMGQGVNTIFFSEPSSVCKEVNAPHFQKHREIYLPHNFYYGTPTKQPPHPPLNMMAENRKMIGTVVDSGGNIVSVVYSDSDTATQPYCIMTCENRERNAHPMGEFSPFQRGNLNTVGNHLKDYDFGNQQQQPQQSQSHPFHDPVNHRAQLIENFVGNWVPTQSGTYSPFGCTDRMRQVHLNQQAVQTTPLTGELFRDQKIIDRNVKKDRLVAEVHPMRPTYSDVLTKSPPSTTAPVKSNASHTNVNDKAYLPNISKSKVSMLKCNSSKRNNKNSALKRQHSSGSEEHSINTNMNSGKLNQNPGLTQKSTANCLKHNNFELNFDDLNFNSLSRKWVSLDDLDNNKETAEQIFQTENVVPSKSSNSSGGGGNKKSVGSSSSKSKYDEGTTLNNHKPAYSPSGKGPGGLGGPSTKRPPIHINNNLGTSTWSSGKGTGEKNIVKGNSGVKNCRNSPEDRKGSKNDTKTGSSGANSIRLGSSRSSSVSGNHNLSSSEKTGHIKRRSKKKDCHSPLSQIYHPIKIHMRCWSHVAVQILLWFFHLLSDVLSMSGRLFVHLCAFIYDWLCMRSVCAWKKLSDAMIHLRLLERFGLRSDWWNFWQTSSGDNDDDFKDGLPLALENNISLPATGEEAMRRLLACKGKDPYSILGVTPNCTDDDIKKYYKRQAVLVHPDKNNQPGAEEAFKILVHAFELIGEPEQRSAYDRRVAETHQVEQAWSELNELLAQLHKKMEYAANTIRCTNCGKRHRRIPLDRPCYAARFCAQCKIHHNAREGDIWAESTMYGFLWHYYACMDGGVYDITEWAACQADNMKHLRANTHTVQYRIVLGRQSQQSHGRHQGGKSAQRATPEANSEPDLEDFLNNLYSQQGGSGGSAGEGGRNRKKGKRKK